MTEILNEHGVGTKDTVKEPANERCTCSLFYCRAGREISAGLVEKLLKLDRSVAERFYALYREQLNPDLMVPDAVVEESIRKISAKPQQVVDWRLPKEPDAGH